MIEENEIKSCINAASQLDNTTEAAKKVKAIVDKLLEDFWKLLSDYNAEKSFTKISEMKARVVQANEAIDKVVLSTYVKGRAKAITSFFLRKLEAERKKILPPKKSTPSEMERRLIWQQRILVEDEKIAEAFDKALKKISSAAKTEDKFVGHILIVGARAKDPEAKVGEPDYLSWVYPFLKTLKQHLKKAGIGSVNIIHENETTPGRSIGELERQINESFCTVLLCGTEHFLKSHEFPYSPIHGELVHVKRKIEEDVRAERMNTVIPMLLSGDATSSLPPVYAECRRSINWNDKGLYFENLRLLINTLYSIPAPSAGEDPHPVEKAWSECLADISDARYFFESPVSITAEIMDAFDKAEAMREREAIEASNRAVRRIIGTDIAASPNGIPRTTATATITATATATATTRAVDIPLSPAAAAYNTARNLVPMTAESSASVIRSFNLLARPPDDPKMQSVMEAHSVSTKADVKAETKNASPASITVSTATTGSSASLIGSCGMLAGPPGGMPLDANIVTPPLNAEVISLPHGSLVFK